MESIDNLREWVNGLRGAWIDTKDNSLIFTTGDDMPPSMASVNLREHLNGILDGIEREVKQLREREYQNGREDTRDAAEFADRLKASVDGREDVTLWGVDYVALPLDADGEPIRVGDVMENIVCPPVHREVTGVGVECFYGWDDGNGRYSQFDVNCYRHHHAPTVEDVLREFAAKLIERGELTNGAAQTIAEYAAKLTLRGDE